MDPVTYTKPGVPNRTVTTPAAAVQAEFEGFTKEAAAKPAAKRAAKRAGKKSAAKPRSGPATTTGGKSPLDA